MAVDNFYSNVSLLLHCNGTDASTTFTDNSPAPKTITANGNAQIDTAQSQWGGASALFDGTGDYLSTPYDQAAFDWWTTDFTIECWVRPTTLSTFEYNDGGVLKPVLLGCAAPASNTNYWSFGPIASGAIRFSYFNGTSVTVTSTATLSAGAWTYIAMVKNASGINLYVGATGMTPVAVSGTPQSSTSGVVLTIGQINSRSIDGWVDDLRITKGVARSISVPTEAFPDSGPTPLIFTAGAKCATDPAQRVVPILPLYL